MMKKRKLIVIIKDIMTMFREHRILNLLSEKTRTYKAYKAYKSINPDDHDLVEVDGVLFTDGLLFISKEAFVSLYSNEKKRHHAKRYLEEAKASKNNKYIEFRRIGNSYYLRATQAGEDIGWLPYYAERVMDKYDSWWLKVMLPIAGLVVGAVTADHIKSALSALNKLIS